jgi:serine/threonine-protein kinase HipA
MHDNDRYGACTCAAAGHMGRPFTGQFNLAGAEVKTALLLRDGRWGVPSGSTPTTQILNPAVTGFDDHDLNEHLCLDAARRAGLLVVRTSISRFGDETAVVVTPYDRRTTPTGAIRVLSQPWPSQPVYQVSTKFGGDQIPGVRK